MALRSHHPHQSHRREFEQDCREGDELMLPLEAKVEAMPNRLR